MVNDEQDTADGMPKNEKKLRTREPTVKAVNETRDC